MENYTAKQGGDGIVAKDAKLLLRTGQLTSNMMYTGYIREMMLTGLRQHSWCSSF